MPDDAPRDPKTHAPPSLAHCPTCGYDLAETNLDTKPCPECGWVGTPEEPERARRVCAFEHRARHRAMFCVVAMAMAPAFVFVARGIVAGYWYDALYRIVVLEIPLAFALIVGLVCSASKAPTRQVVNRRFIVWCIAAPWLLIGWIGTMAVGVVGGTPGPASAYVLGAIAALALGGWLYVWPARWTALRSQAGLNDPAAPTIIGAATVVIPQLIFLGLVALALLRKA